MLPQVEAITGRRVLVDVGANEWLGSPKALIEHYAAADAPFHEAHLFDPRLPDKPFATPLTTVHHHPMAVAVGTRDGRDVLAWLEQNVKVHDYVALKFDVDDDFSEGPTMEWGFLADLLASGTLELVDELFIELHFFSPGIRWLHTAHSMQQAFDVLRQLRSCGLAVHAWP